LSTYLLPFLLKPNFHINQNEEEAEGHEPLFEQREKNASKLVTGHARASMAVSGAKNMIKRGQATFIEMLKQVQGAI
jgi:hypothetical protein